MVAMAWAQRGRFGLELRINYAEMYLRCFAYTFAKGVFVGLFIENRNPLTKPTQASETDHRTDALMTQYKLPNRQR